MRKKKEIDPNSPKTMMVGRIFKLYPNDTQRKKAYQWSNGLRGIWNRLLKWVFDYRIENGKYPSKKLRQEYLVNTLKKQEGNEWMCDIPAHALLALNDDMQVAFDKWFKRDADKPRFKGKYGKKQPSVYAVNCNLEFDGNKVNLPKLGWVRFRGGVPPGRYVSGRIKQRAGNWYLSAVFEQLAPEITLAPKAKCGTDVGSRKLAVIYDGEQYKRYENPKALQKNLGRLKFYQRQKDRRQKGSKRRLRSQRHLARVHQRIANVRMDAHHKATTDIVRNYQNITIETLSVKNMMKNHHLAQTLADASMSKFLGYIKYKSDRDGRHLVEANRFFASSKTCKCGHKHKELGSKELFVCPQCGYTADRDEHGAQNLYEYSPEAIGTAGGKSASKRTRKSESSEGDVLPIAVPFEILRKQKEPSILKPLGNLPD